MQLEIRSGSVINDASFMTKKVKKIMSNFINVPKGKFPEIRINGRLKDGEHPAELLRIQVRKFSNEIIEYDEAIFTWFVWPKYFIPVEIKKSYLVSDEIGTPFFELVSEITEDFCEAPDCLDELEGLKGVITVKNRIHKGKNFEEIIRFVPYEDQEVEMCNII